MALYARAKTLLMSRTSASASNFTFLDLYALASITKKHDYVAIAFARPSRISLIGDPGIKFQLLFQFSNQCKAGLFAEIGMFCFTPSRWHTLKRSEPLSIFCKTLPARSGVWS